MEMLVTRNKNSNSAGAARTDVAELQQRWGADIDPELLILALTHRSFAHEAGGIPTNERLEFLGDSVLGIIVTEFLFRQYPDNAEGQLAKMRAATVSQPALAQVARDLELGDFILLGKGEMVTGGRQKDSILSDTVEALIGATYLCHGLEATRRVVEALVGDLLHDAAERGENLDWKTTLLELATHRDLGAPVYEVSGTGPDHDRSYHAVANVGGVVMSTGDGPSKKLAEHEAARAAVLALRQLANNNTTNPPA